MIISDQFGIIQNLQTSPIPKTSFLVGTSFAASHSKTALVLVIGFVELVQRVILAEQLYSRFLPKPARKESNAMYKSNRVAKVLFF